MIAFAMYCAWAVGSVIVFGGVLLRAWKEERFYRDNRSRHELYIAIALFMVAVSVLVSILLAIMGSGPLFRLGFSALALGAYLGAGIVILLELPRGRR